MSLIFYFVLLVPQMDVVGMMLAAFFIEILYHLIFEAFEDGLPLSLNDLVETLVRDLHLIGVIESELFPLERIVELIAVVDPAFRDNWHFLRE